MNIIGINSKYSLPADDSFVPRHLLNDGATALICNGHIEFASIEERHTRQRYSGGFLLSLKQCLEYSGLNLTDVHALAFSSCCGPKWSSEQDVIKETLANSFQQNFSSQKFFPKVTIVDHHDSHAALGFVLSGFERALVATLDGFGNLLTDKGWDIQQWWNGSFERHSYYIAEKQGIYFSLNKISEDAAGQDEIGIGELYSALTHFCGWDSYQHAGTVMALAAFGNPTRYSSLKLIDFDEDTLRIRMPNNHINVVQTFYQLLQRHGIDLPPMTGRTVTVSDETYCDLIAKVQLEVEEALVCRLIAIANNNSVDNIVVSGGVALNCLAMGKLAKNFHGKVFISPAPSDTGQALGNAIWASFCTSSSIHQNVTVGFNNSKSPFWGKEYDYSSIMKALSTLDSFQHIDVTHLNDRIEQSRIAAKALAAGALVATCIGGAEYGPRALGARSIIADPRCVDIIGKLNYFKKREPFRPFAPAILDEHKMDFLDVAVDSPFMSFAVPFKEAVKAIVPAAIHADGTARVQTVMRDSSSPLRSLLEQFYLLTGVPLLLNTSFNRKGEPIVETPLNAIQSFVDSNLDMLLLDNFIISRRKEDMS